MMSGGVRTGRKTDLRQDVDELTKSMRDLRATTDVILEVVNKRLSAAQAAVEALGDLGGRPPCRVVDILVGRDQYLATDGKRVTIHWTPVGLLVAENGKQVVTREYHVVFDFPMPPRLLR